jgi:uncharacterized protein YjbI with pentapeptide repeats
LSRKKSKPASYTKNTRSSDRGLKYSSLEQLAEKLENLPIARIFNSISSFALILTIVAFIWQYYDRDMNVEEFKLSKIVSSWQLLTEKATGNSGKKAALEYLNSIKEPLIGIDLSVNDVEPGVYLRGVKLPNANLTQSNLARANLMDSELKGASLDEANFSKANFWRAQLSNVNSIRGIFIEASFFEANLSGSRFGGAIFARANMSSVDISNALFSQSNMNKVVLSNANASNITISESNLTGVQASFVDFYSANLLESSFIGAKLFRSNFKKANFSNSSLVGADLWASNMEDSNLQHTDLKNARLHGVYNLTCKQLTAAHNWEQAYRAEELACNAPVPKDPVTAWIYNTDAGEPYPSHPVSNIN